MSQAVLPPTLLNLSKLKTHPLTKAVRVRLLPTKKQARLHLQVERNVQTQNLQRQQVQNPLAEGLPQGPQL